MEKGILQYIVTSKKQGRKLLAILLDPDKLSLDEIPNTIEKINNCVKNIEIFYINIFNNC